MFQSFVTDHNFSNTETFPISNSLTLSEGKVLIVGSPQAHDFTRFGFPTVNAVEDAGICAFVSVERVSNNNCLFSCSCNASMDTVGLTAFLVRVESSTPLKENTSVDLSTLAVSYYPIAPTVSSSDGVLSLSGKATIDTYPRIASNKNVYIGVVFYARSWKAAKGLLSYSLRQVTNEPRVFQPMK